MPSECNHEWASGRLYDLERCTKCGQERKSRSRRDLLRRWPRYIPFALIVVASIWALTLSNSNSPQTTVSDDQASAPTVPTAPTAKPNRHAERQAAYDWYMRVVTHIAYARAVVAVSKDVLLTGDAGSTSEVLAKAKDAADQAFDIAGNDRPSGWDEPSQEFVNASKELSDAIGGVRDYLDDPKPSMQASIDENITDSVDSYASAVHKSRVLYMAMGGQWSDLTDGQTLETAAEALLRSVLGSGSNGSSGSN